MQGGLDQDKEATFAALKLWLRGKPALLILENAEDAILETSTAKVGEIMMLLRLHCQRIMQVNTLLPSLTSHDLPD